MAQKLIRTDVYEAVRPFRAGSVIVQVGHTVVAGHPLLKGRDAFFRPWRPTFDASTASAEPEKPEPAPEKPEADGEA